MSFGIGRFCPNSIDQDDTKEPKSLKSSFINMAEMLNAFDGLTAGDDRVLIITTNNIDNIPEALVRPGRIDRKFYIGYFDTDMLSRYLGLFYGKTYNMSGLEIKEGVSGALVQGDIQSGLTDEQILEKYTEKI